MKNPLDTRDIKHVLLDKGNARRFLYLDALCPCLGRVMLARIAKEAGIVLRNGGTWKASTIATVRQWFPAEWYFSDDEQKLKSTLRHQLCLEALSDAHLCLTILNILKSTKPQTIPIRENLAYLAIYNLTVASSNAAARLLPTPEVP